MEDVWEEERTTRPVTLADRLRVLEKKIVMKEREEETKEKTKQFKFPRRWRMKFKKSTKKKMREMMLVFFLNKKNEMEAPKFMPIFDGNMIVWKNKPYEFDPRAIWTVLGMKGNPKAYLIKEIDRRPVRNKFGKVMYKDAAVSNMDLDEVRARGDSTESDEFLIKAALKAQTTQIRGKVNIAVFVIIGIIVVGGLVYFLSS